MSVPMSNVDHFWLCMDHPTNMMVISGFMEFKESMGIAALRSILEQRLCRRFDRFKMRVVKPLSGVGVPDWEVDPHFDIRSHVHRMALPSPGNKATLCEVIGDLIAVPLDPSKPLWQAHLIENYGNGCVILFRLHHCIADGIALIQVLLSMTDEHPDADQKKAGHGKKGGKSLSGKLSVGNIVNTASGAISSGRKLGRRVFDEVTAAVTNPLHLIELARTGAGLAGESLVVLTRLLLMPPHPKNSFRGNLGVRKCVTWTDPIPLGNVKTVSKAIESTLNDVLIATVTGALRRYLKTRNDKVNELELTVAVPVNIRKPGTELELGNKFSLVFLSLPVYIEDPVLRLREVKRRMDNLKQSPDAFVGFQLLNTLGMSPAKLARKAAELLANKTTAVMTNVPGPRKPLYFAGQKIENMMFWVPRSGRVGLGISIFSYDGCVTVGLAADEGLIPDPQVILEGFEQDLRYMLNLVESGKVFADPLVLHDRYLEKVSKSENKEDTIEFEPIGQEPESKPETKPISKPVQSDESDKHARCQATTTKGGQCKNRAVENSRFCRIHQKLHTGSKG